MIPNKIDEFIYEQKFKLDELDWEFITESSSKIFDNFAPRGISKKALDRYRSIFELALRVANGKNQDIIDKLDMNLDALEITAREYKLLTEAIKLCAENIPGFKEDKIRQRDLQINE